MEYLRKLKFTDDKPMVDNYRPVQDLHDREVKYSVNETTTETTAASTTKPVAGAGIIDISVGLFSLMLLTALFGR